jgi:DNA-binding transcriptional LysR family regulator
MNLTHLRYFYDAVRLKSVSRAARENFVSQSAISQGIRRLEQAVGTKLSTHQRQHFRLTEAGEVVFDESKRIFASVEGLKERLREHKNEISGPVVFGCTNALAQFFLPRPYLELRKKYPDVIPKFHRGSLHFIHEALKQEKVQFALAIDAPEFYEYQKQVLYKGHFRLYKAKGTKRSGKVLVDHATNQEVIEFRKLHHVRYGKDLVIQDELSGWAMVATFVQMGIAEGFLPDFIFQNNPAVQEIKLDLPYIEYQIAAFWLKGHALSRASKAFLQCVT